MDEPWKKEEPVETGIIVCLLSLVSTAFAGNAMAGTEEQGWRENKKTPFFRQSII